MSNSRKPKGRTVPPQQPRLNLKPGLTIMHVQHDAWCRTLKTQRADDCHCSPVIAFVHPFDKERRR